MISAAIPVHNIMRKNAEGKNEENIEFTSDASRIKQADFVLICVPTPVTKSNHLYTAEVNTISCLQKLYIV